ncbi:MAG: hypothetical protein ACI4RC_03065 [Oscillospiraceae bacterium]
MIENDTVKLLRECDAGIKMGINVIDGSLDYVHSRRLKKLLKGSMKEHKAIDGNLQNLLDRYEDNGKSLPAMARIMSQVKLDFKLALNSGDHTVADFITDGCNMGIKSLSKYLNQYAAADEKSKDIAKKLIAVEEKMSVDLRDFL